MLFVSFNERQVSIKFGVDVMLSSRWKQQRWITWDTNIQYGHDNEGSNTWTHATRTHAQDEDITLCVMSSSSCIVDGLLVLMTERPFYWLTDLLTDWRRLHAELSRTRLTILFFLFIRDVGSVPLSTLEGDLGHFRRLTSGELLSPSNRKTKRLQCKVWTAE